MFRCSIRANAAVFAPVSQSSSAHLLRPTSQNGVTHPALLNHNAGRADFDLRHNVFHALWRAVILVAPPPQNMDEGKPWPIYFRTMAEYDTGIECYAQQSS
jgi:hypothetical protein